MSVSGPSGPLVLFNLIILNGVNYPNIVFRTRLFFNTVMFPKWREKLQGVLIFHILWKKLFQLFFNNTRRRGLNSSLVCAVITKGDRRIVRRKRGKRGKTLKSGIYTMDALLARG